MVSGFRSWWAPEGRVSENPRLTYQPALDGLRALAVGSVIAYHLGFGWARGGFLGVDAFFVLSGFLITSLLLREWDTSGAIRFARFWMHRARRLLPALLLVLLAVAAYAAISVPAQQLNQFRGDGIATLFYGANWRLIATGQSYFTLFTEASPLRHMWSLAIEEQFYLVWPLITFACLYLARGRRWLLVTVCGVGTTASILTMALVYDPADPSRAYYGTDSRAHMLLIGCLLAVGLMRWGPRIATTRTAVDAAGAIGIAYCVWAWASIHDTSAWMYYGGYAVFGVAVAAVITSAVQPGNGPLRAVLSVRPAVWVGRISYGLYLWHWPVIVVMTPARTGLSGWELSLARIAVTVAIATLSFYLVELPIRRGRLRRRVAFALPTAFVGAGVAVLVATAGAAPLPAYLGAAGQVVTAPGEHRGDVSNATPGGTTTSAPGRVLVIGDSLAVSLAPGLAEAGAANGIQVSSRAFSGCGLITGAPLDPKGKLYPWSKECSDAIPRHEVDAVHETQPNLVLWLSGAWDARDRIIGGNTVRIGTASGDRVVLQLIDDAVRRLTAGGSSLAIVIPAPDAPGSQLAADPRRNKRLGHLNRLLREYAASHGIEVAELAPIMCPHGEPCPRVLDGIRLRPDGYHFSSKASRWVADRLLPGLLPSFSSTAANANGL